MKQLLCAVALLCAYAGAQTINPNQIRPGTQDGQVFTTVTANQPPSWQQVSHTVLQHNGTPLTDQSLLNFLDDGTIAPDAGYTLAKFLPNGSGGLAAEYLISASGSGTLGFIPLWTPNGTTLGNSHLDDGVTTPGQITSTKTINSIVSGQDANAFFGINNGTSTLHVEAANFLCPNIATSTISGCALGIGKSYTGADAERLSIEYRYGGSVAANRGALSMSISTTDNQEALMWDWAGNVYLPQLPNLSSLATDSTGKIIGGSGGITTNPLTAAATGGAAPGTTFNGSAAVTFDYHSFGAAPVASPTFTGTVNLPFTTIIGGTPISGQFWGYDGTSQGWFTPTGGGGGGCTGATANGVCFNSSGTGTYASDVKIDVGGTPNVAVSPNSVGVSIDNGQAATVSQLASLTTSNSILSVGSFVRVSDAASCGDVTTGGGSVKETIECTTITTGACSAWTLYSCNSVSPANLTPATIAGLTYWYAADQIQAQTNGTGVMHWYNTYTGGILTALNTPGPTYNTAQLNSLPAVTFPGSTVGEMAIQYPVTLKQSTTFVVFKPSTVTAIGIFDGGATGAMQLRTTPSGFLEMDKDFVSIIATDTTALTAGTWYQADVTYDGISTGNWGFRVDRAAGASGTNLLSITAATSSFGYSAQSASPFFGQIAEIIVYGRVLSGAEITTVENYLHSKWGV
jgi:hypothetical protein